MRLNKELASNLLVLIKIIQGNEPIQFMIKKITFWVLIDYANEFWKKECSWFFQEYQINKPLLSSDIGYYYMNYIGL